MTVDASPRTSSSSNDIRTSLIGNDRLARSATNVIGMLLTSVGVNNEVPYQVNESEILCSICLEAMDEEEGNLLTVPECSHTFHIHCIARWKEVSRKCPCCRGPLSDDIGPTFSRLRSLPADEPPSDMTRCAIICNVIFCPLGIVYPLVLVSLFLALETIVFALFMAVILFLSTFYIFEDEDNSFLKAICISLFFCVTSPFFACCFVGAYAAQIFYTLYRTVKFYFNVFMCKLRWSSADNYIIQRTLTVTGHIIDIQ